MVKLHFKSTDEFEGLFKRKTLSVTRSIVQGVENAMKENKRTAPLFEITFENAEIKIMFYDNKSGKLRITYKSNIKILIF